MGLAIVKIIQYVLQFALELFGLWKKGQAEDEKFELDQKKLDELSAKIIEERKKQMGNNSTHNMDNAVDGELFGKGSK